MPSIYFSAEASHISPMLATVSRNLIMRQHVSSINPKMWCSSSPSLKLPKLSICLTFSSRMTSKIVRAYYQRETTSYSFLLSFTFPAERASSHLIQRLGVMTWKSALIHMYYLLSLQKRIGLEYVIRLTSLRHRKRHIPHQDFSTTWAQWLKIYQKSHSTLRA